MSCKKHTQRKRKDCPDCFPQTGIEDKTSREMLAEVSSLEKEVDEMVIEPPKVERKKKVEKPKEENVEDPVINNSVSDPDHEILKIEVFSEAVNKIISDGIAEFKSKIREMCDVKHEWLDIPYDNFSVKVLDQTHNDGWKLVNFYRGECAKGSGFKGDVALFTRVCNPTRWRKSLTEWKEFLKNGNNK
jgi:hypothetical protein